MLVPKMSVPRRDAGRETEPARATGKLCWSLIKANVSMKGLEACKDGKGLFTRSGDQIKDLVEKHRAMLGAMSDVAFFPKKTTLQDAIEKANKDLEHKLLQQGSGRIKLARAEAHMLSNR
jgi:hypothetical protein